MSPDEAAREQVIKARAISGLFGAIGLLLIVVSSLLDAQANPTLQAAVLNVGVVVLSVVILELLWRFFGGDPLHAEIQALRREVGRLEESANIVKQRESTGLVAVHDSLGNFGNQQAWLSLIAGASESVDLLGRSLFGWHDEKELEKIICYKIKHDGVVFRWLIMSPDNPFLGHLDEKEKAAFLTPKIEQMRILLRKISEQLPPDRRANLKLRGFRTTPLTCSVLRFDDRFFVNQYLTSRSSKESPLLLLKGESGAWPRAYIEEFRELWKSAHDLLVFEEDPRGQD